KRWVIGSILSRTYYHNMVTHLLQAAYQREVYHKVDQGESLNAPTLNEIMLNVYKQFFGDAVDPTKLPKGDISKYQSTAHAAEQSTYGNHFIDTIVHIIPTNFFEDLNKGELLPIIFFAVFFGLGLPAVGKKAEPVKEFLTG
ncbi:cation:dicarboxylate symporter family transporter, partial [Staphylococcus aureus]|uniref:cation:dicarboxylate symporter family transporter n=1 Tax=Staphylococcus aureus TaxID=1280 RepID=UPI0021091031